jgi:hypothetical protein
MVIGLRSVVKVGVYRVKSVLYNGHMSFPYDGQTYRRTDVTLSQRSNGGSFTKPRLRLGSLFYRHLFFKTIAYRTEQNSTEQYSTEQCSTPVQYSTVQYIIV